MPGEKRYQAVKKEIVVAHSNKVNSKGWWAALPAEKPAVGGRGECRKKTNQVKTLSKK